MGKRLFYWLNDAKSGLFNPCRNVEPARYVIEFRAAKAGEICRAVQAGRNNDQQHSDADQKMKIILCGAFCGPALRVYCQTPSSFLQRGAAYAQKVRMAYRICSADVSL